MLTQRKVLVQNKGRQPLGLVTMQRAITLLFSCNRGTNEPKAKIIDPETWQWHTWEEWSKMKPKDGEDTLLSAHAAFRAPLVIVLTKYNKLPQHKVSFSRKTLWRRDDYQCQYCGCRNGEMTIDHIVPKSKGGTTSWENCCLACVKCNAKKADMTPKQAGMKFFHPGFKPAKPQYNFFKNDIVKCKTWQQFFEAAYWNVPLEN